MVLMRKFDPNKTMSSIYIKYSQFQQRTKESIAYVMNENQLTQT